MTAQSIGAVLVTTAVCTVAAVVALMRQAGRHADDRAALLRGQMDAYRAGQESMRDQEDESWPGPEWWDRQFEGITSELGNNEWEGL